MSLTVQELSLPSEPSTALVLSFFLPILILNHHLVYFAAKKRHLRSNTPDKSENLFTTNLREFILILLMYGVPVAEILFVIISINSLPKNSEWLAFAPLIGWLSGIYRVNKVMEESESSK